MQLIPAVDIRGGRCVRLVGGDFAREKRYVDDPIEMARDWEAQGASRLHVVDLDGARDGVRANAAVIRVLLRAVGIPVQVGGGIRSLQMAQALVEEGADRVVVGTAAAEQPEALATWVQALGPEALVIGVDSRGGLIATRGWQQTSSVRTLDFCQTLKRAGVERVLYTDVGRDGRLEGPDVAGTRGVAAVLKVIASGGVTTLDDIRALAAAGAESAIVGTALYEGRLSLVEALAVAC
jgi:phosphoribosylformimino-5-aminoimidazole carboxamide ribotide isomerase